MAEDLKGQDIFPAVKVRLRNEPPVLFVCIPDCRDPTLGSSPFPLPSGLMLCCWPANFESIDVPNYSTAGQGAFGLMYPKIPYGGCLTVATLCGAKALIGSGTSEGMLSLAFLRPASLHCADNNILPHQKNTPWRTLLEVTWIWQRYQLPLVPESALACPD